MPRRTWSKSVGMVLVAAAATLMFANTAFAQVPRPNSALQSTAWRWVHSVVDDDTFVVPLDRDRYTIEFGANGRLSIQADCNQVGGAYLQIGRRLWLELGPSTLVACPPGSRADEFLQQLGAVVSQAGTDTALVLNLQQDSGSMVFEAQPVLSLSDSSWRVQSYNNGRGAVTTPLLETEMNAAFGADGMISGFSGCNTYSGSYTTDGTSIAIGPLATTRLACDQAVMDQEQAYLIALEAATQYELSADRLTLRNDDGATQAVFLPALLE